jgi:hypothetical protein
MYKTVVEDQLENSKLLNDFVDIYFPEGNSNVPFADLDQSHMDYAAVRVMAVADDIAASHTMHGLLTLTNLSFVLFICDGICPDQDAFAAEKNWIRKIIKDAEVNRNIVKAVVFAYWVTPTQLGFCAKILNQDEELAKLLAASFKKADTIGVHSSEEAVDKSKLN